MSVQGFWGLQVEPENTYTQVVDASFRVTMAALGENLIGIGRTCVKVVVDDKEFVLCSLSPDKHEQQTLDHIFVEGEEVTFMATGKNAVHLTGNYVPDQEEADDDELEIPPELAALAARMRAAEQGDDMGDDEDTEEVDANPLTKLLDPSSEMLDSDEEDDDYEAGDSDEDEEDDDEEGDLAEAVVNSVANAIRGVPGNSDSDSEEENDIQDDEELDDENGDEDDDDDEEEDEDGNEDDEEEEEIDEMELEKQILSKHKRPGNQLPSAPEAKKQKAEAIQPKAAVGGVRTLSNGMTIEDVKLGQGEKAKAGKKVSMRYIGKLLNGKVFDKNVAGAPFTFALGRGEVIKGWDIGVAGMQIGGERKLIIPAPLAYGKQGSPPVIPRNATLIFDVKLLAIK
ncbi:hypothetical protein INT44_006927 [Umbelopsis vinacea]|uniref:FK506-binding protein n=1 Tax=Umbelopsis vinacea TaxID=44442 RepID=A0A8H7PIN4_9FUNG|nr:hypothetical protein INT44_006927 [Umbelopsis vinacea]